MTEHEVPAELAGERLDRGVATLADISRSVAANLIVGGLVTVGGAVVTQRSFRLEAGQQIMVATPTPTPAPSGEPTENPQVTPVEVRYQDEHLAVVVKPAGLVVHPAPGHRGETLVSRLAVTLDPPPAGGDPQRPGIVHRLDRDTSGLLVVARSEAAYEALTKMMQRREITRAYVALVDRVVEPDSLTIDAPVGRHQRARTRMAVVAEGRDAVTDIEVTERFEQTTLVRATLRTGRTHQIRVHLSAIDHPVSGDVTYGASDRIARALGLERPFLHATHLRFLHPVTGRAIVVDEPLPADLDRVLVRLTAWQDAAAQRRLPPHLRAGSEDDERAGRTR